MSIGVGPCSRRVVARVRACSLVHASALPLGFAVKVSRWTCLGIILRGRCMESRAPGENSAVLAGAKASHIHTGKPLTCRRAVGVSQNAVGG